MGKICKYRNKKGFTTAQIAEKHGWPEPLVWSVTKVGSFGGRADYKGALIVKAAIRRQNMQVWMEIF